MAKIKKTTTNKEKVVKVTNNKIAKIKKIKKVKKGTNKGEEVKEQKVELPPLKRFSDEPVQKKVRKSLLSRFFLL